MTDVDLSVLINRDLLGLGELEIASDPVYYLAPTFLGGNVQWDRQSASSRWVDGDYTTSRRRGTVMEAVQVEIKCATLVEVQAAMQVLIDAFTQDHYTMTITAGSALYVYDCESADYQNAMWTTPRLASPQGQIVFNVPRRPVASVGN